MKHGQHEDGTGVELIAGALDKYSVSGPELAGK